MKIELVIPDRIKEDYEKDRLDEFFSRMIADIDCDGLCGLYEKEIAEDLKQAFSNSKIIQ